MARPGPERPSRNARPTARGARAPASVALALALSLGLAPVPAPAAPDGAPLAGLALDGPAGPVALDDYLGGWTYVDFYASWCVPCRASFPFMDALAERHADDGLAVLAIGLDEDPADARAFAERLAPRFDVAFDPAGASAEAMDLKGMPSSYLLAPDGRVVWSHVGFRRADADGIARAVADAIGAGAFADADGDDR